MNSKVERWEWFPEEGTRILQLVQFIGGDQRKKYDLVAEDKQAQLRSAASGEELDKVVKQWAGCPNPTKDPPIPSREQIEKLFKEKDERGYKAPDPATSK